MQFGLRWLLVAVSCLAVLFALRQFLWAGLLVCTLLSTLFLDWIATRLSSSRGEQTVLPPTTIRRFWHPATTAPGRWKSPGPLHVTVFYLVFSQIWHSFMWMLPAQSFWMYTSPIGLSLLMLDHTVNAMFIVYLVVVLVGAVSPHTRAPRTEVVGLIAALLGVAGMHVVIASVSRF